MGNPEKLGHVSSHFGSLNGERNVQQYSDAYLRENGLLDHLWRNISLD
jgi:hypothetical protein